MMKELNGFIFVLFLVFVFNRDVVDGSEFENDPNYNSKYLLKRRFRSLDYQGPAPDPLAHPPNRRTGLDGEGPNEFYPDYGHPNSNAGFNRGNQGNAAESNKQYDWGSNNQNSGRLNSQNSAGNQQGNQSSRPIQSGGQNNSNKRPNQNSGQKNSSSQNNGRSNSTASGGGSTTQRPPLNIILNENTMDNSTIRDCIQKRCPSTNEYNPVCGDDNTTYQNPSKFKCAQWCQSGVKMSYRGSCVTTPSPN